MTGEVNLGNAAWFKRGDLASLLAQLNRDGEEARVVGGAVRNELLHIEVVEVDIATTAVPDEVARRAEARGLESGADRYRAWHGHSGDRRQTVRSDDLAAGRRDLRP